jgi:hypothetical protein
MAKWVEQKCHKESFWHTVVTSPQWKAWEKEVSQRLHIQNKILDEEKPGVLPDYCGIWDVAECTECGYISQRHFQDFIRWTEISAISKHIDNQKVIKENI